MVAPNALHSVANTQQVSFPLALSADNQLTTLHEQRDTLNQFVPVNHFCPTLAASNPINHFPPTLAASLSNNLLDSHPFGPPQREQLNLSPDAMELLGVPLDNFAGSWSEDIPMEYGSFDQQFSPLMAQSDPGNSLALAFGGDSLSGSSIDTLTIALAGSQQSIVPQPGAESCSLGSSHYNGCGFTSTPEASDRFGE
jgi:hypothetical protein